MDAPVLKTLAHRLGVRELDDALRKQLTVDFGSDSLLELAVQSKDWQIRAAALAIAFQRFGELDCETMVQSVLANIDHENNRTRLETLPLIRQLAQTFPEIAWNRLAKPLLTVAKSTIQLDEDTRGIEAERQGMKETKQPELEDFEFCEVYKDMALEIDIYRTKLFSTLALEDPNNHDAPHERGSVRSSRLSSSGWSARRRLDSGQVVLMVHETVGWKSLETSLRGLNELLPANNTNDFAFAITQQALAHSNRFVRVVAYQLVETLCSNAVGFPQIATWIKRGMCDHVNEVRLRACFACRALVQTITKKSDTDLLTLAPALCLNRHYPQVGIRDPSIEAWRLGGFTRDMVASNVLVFCRFFIQQSSCSRDEFAREASCCAMGELANRILDCSNADSLQEITNALLARLTDSSWSVQAAACQAIGEAACKQPSTLVSTKLVEALVGCASDLIWSVRNEAAITLAKLCNEEHMALVRAKCREMMLRAPTAHHHHHHPPTDNQVMFACCSSEINDKAKLKKQDFQYVDGGLRLFRELMVQSKITDEALFDRDPLLEDFLNFVQRDNARHDVVEETVWQLVVPLAQRIGKKQFKRKALDAILPSLVRALEHPCFSAAYRASLACQFFKEWVGENILRARVEAISPSLWGIVERNPPHVFDSPAISFRVMDLDSLADRLDKLSSRRASFEAVRHVNELFATSPLGKSFASTGLLESALENARIRKHFREFIQLAYATENLNFYEAVTELEQRASSSASKQVLLQDAKAIIKQYIQIQAPTPVNLPSSLTQRIRELANNNDENVDLLCESLSTAKREILHLMQTNFFYKFLATVVRRDDPVVEIPLPPTPTAMARSFAWTRASRSSNGGGAGVRGHSPEKVKKARRAYSLLLMDAIGRRKSSKPATATAATTTIPVKSWVDVHVLLQESEASLLAATTETEEQDEEIKVKVHDKEEWTMVIRTSQRFTAEAISAATANHDANKRYSNRLRAISQHDRQLCQDYLQRAVSQRGLDPLAVEEIQSQIKALESFEREVNGATVELEREEEIKLLELITNNNTKSKPEEKMNPTTVLAIVFAILCYWFLFAR